MNSNYYPSEAAAAGSGSNNAYLRKVLNTMFPPSYILCYHTQPNSICSLLNTTQQRNANCLQQEQSTDCTYEVSTEPMSRSNLINFRDEFNASLVEHQAKQAGLCPIRRAIYDQCFGRLNSVN